MEAVETPFSVDRVFSIVGIPPCLMSTAIQPTPVQTPPPAAKLSEPSKPRGLGWLWTLLVLGGLGAAGYAGYKAWTKPAPDPQAVVSTARTAAVQSGPMEYRLRAAGSTNARNFANVVAPLLRGPEMRGSLILMKLAAGGSMVKKGDLVAQIDGQSLVDHIDDVKDQVRQAQNDVLKRKAEQAVEAENLNQTILMAKSQWDKAKLEFQAAEVRTDVEQELLKLTLDETEARYKQQLSDVKQRQAAHAAELKILNLTVERHQRHHDRHVHDLEKFTIYAPMNGLVVLTPLFRGGEMVQIGEGDQVNPGQQILKIVDPASMQVEANVNQSESDQIRIGQEVRVGFDSFPGLRLKGRIAGMNALAKSGGRDNYFIRQVGVRIQIIDQDTRVIPDLSAYGDVLISRQESTVHVPSSALLADGGKTFLFVKAGDKFAKREVTTGFRNNTDTAILSGVKPGEEVRIN